MGESYHLPADGKPFSTPGNPSCSLCGRARHAIHRSGPWRRVSKTYLICVVCDRETIPWTPGFPKEVVPEDS